MRKRIVISVFGALIMLFAAYNAHAEMGGYPPMPHSMMHHDMEMCEGMGTEFPMWRPLMDVGLDEKQREEIKEIENGIMRDTIRMKATVQLTMIEMKDVLDKDPVDMKAAETKLRKIESLITDIRLSQMKAFEEAKAKLTAGQKMKLREMLRKGPIMGRMMPGEHKGIE